MGFENNRVTAPIDINDVCVALSETDLDIGKVCTSQNINIWAKYKPTILDSPVTTSESWKGEDGNCGFTVPVVTDAALHIIKDYYLLMHHYYTDNNGWIYNRPQEGNWLRLTDFEGYYTKALAPFKDADGDPNVVVTESEVSVSFPLNRVIVFSDSNIQLSDCSSMAGIDYLGVLIYGIVNGENVSKLLISQTTLNYFGNTLSFSNPGLPIGSYTVYYLLGSRPGTYTVEDDDELTVATLPVVAPITLSVISDSSSSPNTVPVTITINTAILDEYNGINVGFTIKNITSVEVIIYSVEVEVFAKSTDTTPTDTAGKTMNVTLPMYNENLGVGLIKDSIAWVSSISTFTSPKIKVKVNTGLKTIEKESPLFIVNKL